MALQIEQMFYNWKVSHNPPKNDAWPPYPDVRFVLVRNIGRLRPSRGFVLDWYKKGHAWTFHVVWFDDTLREPVTKIEWLTASQLIPVRVDPNLTGREGA